MKKLRLDPDALHIESFEPDRVEGRHGTVRPHGWSEPDCRETVEPQATCYATCGPSCQSCVGYYTCAYTCSCNTVCGGITCANTCGCEPY